MRRREGVALRHRLRSVLQRCAVLHWRLYDRVSIAAIMTASGLRCGTTAILSLLALSPPTASGITIFYVGHKAKSQPPSTIRSTTNAIRRSDRYCWRLCNVAALTRFFGRIQNAVAPQIRLVPILGTIDNRATGLAEIGACLSAFPLKMPLQCRRRRVLLCEEFTSEIRVLVSIGLRHCHA